MKWITNMEKSRAEGEPDILDIHNCGGFKEAKRDLKEWLKGKRIGIPKGTTKYTALQLGKMGLVGIYVD